MKKSSLPSSPSSSSSSYASTPQLTRNSSSSSGASNSQIYTAIYTAKDLSNLLPAEKMRLLEKISLELESLLSEDVFKTVFLTEENSNENPTETDAINALFSQENPEKKGTDGKDGEVSSQQQKYEPISKDLLRKIAYSWVEFFSPEKALELSSTQAKLETTSNGLIRQIFFIKELILSDVQNQFINTEAFIEKFTTFISSIKKFDDLEKAADTLNFLYTIKSACSLRSLAKERPFLKKSASGNAKPELNAEGSRGILSIYSEKSDLDKLNPEITNVFSEELDFILTSNFISISFFNPNNQEPQQAEFSQKTYTEQNKKLTTWVTGSILFSKEPSERALIITHWGMVAEKLLELSNYDGAMAIYLGLTDRSIKRLENTSSKLSTSHQESSKKMEYLFFGGENSNPHKNIKDLASKNREKGGIIMADILTLKARMSEVITSTYWDKLKLIGDYNFQITKAQEKAVSNKPLVLPTINNIEACLKKENISEKRIENFSKMSYQLEPPILELNKKLFYRKIIDALNGYKHGFAQVQIISTAKKSILALTPTMKTYLGIKALTKLLEYSIENIEKFKKDIENEEDLPTIKNYIEQIEALAKNQTNNHKEKEMENFQKTLKKINALTTKATTSNNQPTNSPKPG